MMKKFIYILTLCCLLVSKPLFSADKLTVLLDWFPNPDHAPLYAAEQQGYFAREGLEVKLIGPADPADPPKLVAAGKADIAITYQPHFLAQVDHHLPLIHIGTLINHPLSCIVALKTNGISKFSDLKGKRIGTSTGEVTSAMLKTMLAKHGLTMKDVKIINVRYNLTQALLTKNVDAVTGMMRNFEIPQLELAGQEVTAFFPENFGIPNYSELIFVANINHARDPRMQKFMAAVKSGVAYVKQHPKEAWAAFAKQFPENNNALNQRAWAATLPYFDDEPSRVDPQEWLKFAEFMQRSGLISKVQPMSRYSI